jgi:hypothetical protein
MSDEQQSILKQAELKPSPARKLEFFPRRNYGSGLGRGLTSDRDPV